MSTIDIVAAALLAELERQADARVNGKLGYVRCDGDLKNVCIDGDFDLEALARVALTASMTDAELVTAIADDIRKHLPITEKK